MKTYTDLFCEDGFEVALGAHGACPIAACNAEQVLQAGAGAAASERAQHGACGAAVKTLRKSKGVFGARDDRVLLIHCVYMRQRACVSVYHGKMCPSWARHVIASNATRPRIIPGKTAFCIDTTQYNCATAPWVPCAHKLAQQLMGLGSPPRTRWFCAASMSVLGVQVVSSAHAIQARRLMQYAGLNLNSCASFPRPHQPCCSTHRMHRRIVMHERHHHARSLHATSHCMPTANLQPPVDRARSRTCLQ